MYLQPMSKIRLKPEPRILSKKVYYFKIKFLAIIHQGVTYTNNLHLFLSQTENFGTSNEYELFNFRESFAFIFSKAKID